MGLIGRVRRRSRIAALAVVTALLLSGCDFSVYNLPLPGGANVGDNPYHVASVAAYCSTDVVGIQRPRGFDPPSVSSGPPSCNFGYVPYNVLPNTAPPTIS